MGTDRQRSKTSRRRVKKTASRKRAVDNAPLDPAVEQLLAEASAFTLGTQAGRLKKEYLALPSNTPRLTLEAKADIVVQATLDAKVAEKEAESAKELVSLLKELKEVNVKPASPKPHNIKGENSHSQSSIMNFSIFSVFQQTRRALAFIMVVAQMVVAQAMNKVTSRLNINCFFAKRNNVAERVEGRPAAPSPQT